MYTLRFADTYKVQYEKITHTDQLLKIRVKKALLLLATNPLHPSLKSHKVASKNHGLKWSSWVTGDIRLIWDYDAEEHIVKIIRIYTIGSHSGAFKVYQ